MELQVLTTAPGAADGALILPAQRSQVALLVKNGVALVAIGAVQAGEPVGLILAEPFPGGRAARVLSLYVAPEQRCQGVGTALVARLETELRERACECLFLGYLPAKTTTAALERILEKQGWAAPTDNRLIWKARVGRMLEAPWAKLIDWPLGYEVFLWHERAAADRALYQQMWEEEQFPRSVGPQPDHEDYEPMNSLGLRRYGRLAGWMVTNRIAPESIRYTWLYSDPVMAKLGRGVPLMAEAVQLQAQQLGPQTLAVAGTVMENPVAMRFVRHRLAPYLLSLEVAKQSVKQLQETANQFELRRPLRFSDTIESLFSGPQARHS